LAVPLKEAAPVLFNTVTIHDMQTWRKLRQESSLVSPAASYITGAVIDLDGYSAYSRFISMFGKSAESELLPKRAA